jgi:hypothetical protein
MAIQVFGVSKVGFLKGRVICPQCGKIWKFMTLNGEVIRCGSCGHELRVPTMREAVAPVSSDPEIEGCAAVFLGLVVLSFTVMTWVYFTYSLHHYFFSQFNPTSFYRLFSSKFQVVNAQVLTVHAFIAEVIFTLTVFLVSDYAQIERFTRCFLISIPLLVLLLPLFSFLGDANRSPFLIVFAIYEVIFVVFCVGVWPAIITGCEFFFDKH